MLRLTSLKFQFIALALVLVVAGLAGRLLLAVPYVQEQIVELVSAQQLSIASYVAQSIDHSLRSRRQLVGELAAELPQSMIERPAELQSWMRERQRVNPLFDVLYLVANDGHRLYGAYPPNPGLGQLDHEQADWFIKARNSHEPVVGKPIRGRLSGSPLIVMAAAVRDPAGRIVAVLAGAALLNSPGLLDALQKTTLGETGGFLLISPKDQIFVGASDPSMILKPTPAPGVNPLHDRAMGGYRGTGITVNARGVEELSAMVSVPSTNWFVVARMPTAEALRPVAAFRRYVWRSSSVLLAVVVLLVIPAVLLLLRPLHSASRAIREMADGKRELQQLPMPRSAEVGDLVAGFNRLVAMLHEKDAALRKSMRQLDQIASTDALTGAWNRRQFAEQSQRELERCKRYGHPVSLLLLDIDWFKKINDEYGHSEGDRVLCVLAERIQATVRRSDSLARWGGEEFVVLMPNTNLRNALDLAERVRAAIVAEPIERIGNVSASLGVAEYSGDETCEDWIARADAEMYQAKRGGRNRVEPSQTSLAVPQAAKQPFVRLTWSDEFCCGEPLIDRQHRDLFEHCNRLLAAMVAEDDEGIGIALTALMGALEVHEQDEKRLIAAFGFAHVEAHDQSHRRLLAMARELNARFAAGGVDIGTLFHFIAKEVVINHILNEDRTFFSCFASAGKSTVPAQSRP